MEITLHSKKIKEAILKISHDEVAGIEDADARYRAEAGTEKKYEILNAIREALRRLDKKLARWLVEEYDPNGNNILEELPEAFVYNFNFSERRAIGKTEALTIAMHTFIVEYSLMKFYSNVSQGELSNKHGLLAVDAGNELEELLFTKNPPRL